MYEKRNQYDVTLESHESIIGKLESLKEVLLNINCFLGFDGYIDSLYSLVLTRESADKWVRMESMKTFGELLVRVAGSSANVERILKRKIAGGFAPNSCRAITNLGIKACLIAALGYPNIDENFIPLTSKPEVEAISFSNPGETAGLEFDNGKVMLTDFENINKITWEMIYERVGLDVLIEKLQECDIMGFGHWSLVPNLGIIWSHFLYDVFPNISELEKKLFFVDLADIKKRTDDDIREMLTILQKIDSKVPVMLSLNDQEAIDISRVLEEIDEIDPNKEDFRDYIEGGKKINDVLRLSYLVIHSPHFATITTKDEHFWMTEGYTSKPRFTTGAGDHFHSGVAAGLACGLTAPEAILFGNSLTAVFVRTGDSPTIVILSQFIKRYLDYIEKENPEFP